jgi:hypothetical protein
MARQSSAAASRRAKTGAGGATCTLTRLMARRFLRPPGLLFHARPPICSRGRWSEAERRTSRCGARPRAKRVNRTGTGNDAQRGLSPPCLRSNHAAKKLVRTEGIAPSWAFAHRLLGPTCLLFHHIRMKKWSIHRDVRPAVCLTKTVRRFLRVGCMVEAEGLAPS